MWIEVRSEGQDPLIFAVSPARFASQRVAIVLLFVSVILLPWTVTQTGKLFECSQIRAGTLVNDDFPPQLTPKVKLDVVVFVLFHRRCANLKREAHSDFSSLSLSAVQPLAAPLIHPK